MSSTCCGVLDGESESMSSFDILLNEAAASWPFAAQSLSCYQRAVFTGRCTLIPSLTWFDCGEHEGLLKIYLVGQHWLQCKCAMQICTYGTCLQAGLRIT